MLPHEELSVKDLHLLVVEKETGIYRLYVSQDRRNYCHYDTGQFESLQAAREAARQGFDPKPFRMFPYAPYSRQEVLEKAPHAFDI